MSVPPPLPPLPCRCCPPPVPAFSPARGLQKQAHRQGAAAPSWLGGGRGGRGGGRGRGRGQQLQEPPPENSGPAPSSGQLKGYSLGAYETAPAVPRDAAPVRQGQQYDGQERQQQQQRRQGGSSQPPRQQQQQQSRQQQQSGQQQQARQGRAQQQSGQQPPHQQQQQQQTRHGRPQQEEPPPERASRQDAAQQLPAQPASAQGRQRGVQLAAEHNRRRQQRHGPGGAPRRGGSPQPGGGEEGGSKRIGRLRLASRQAGYREATPGGRPGGAWAGCKQQQGGCWEPAALAWRSAVRALGRQRSWPALEALGAPPSPGDVMDPASHLATCPPHTHHHHPARLCRAGRHQGGGQ